MDYAELLARWGVSAPRPGEFDAGGLVTLTAIQGAWLARIPFENVTKREAGVPRPADLFWRDHAARGSGGTCFDAAVACGALLDAAGFAARPVLCALPDAGPAAHTALLVELAEGPVLVDVGYALPLPLPLPPARGGGPGTRRQRTPWYDVELMRGVEDELLLSTEDGRGRRFRYRFTEARVPDAEFARAWRATCAPGARYMRGLALGRFRGADRLIFKAPRFLYRLSRAGQDMETLDPVDAATLAERFELPVELVAAGLAKGLADDGAEPD